MEDSVWKCSYFRHGFYNEPDGQANYRIMVGNIEMTTPKEHKMENKEALEALDNLYDTYPAEEVFIEGYLKRSHLETIRKALLNVPDELTAEQMTMEINSWAFDGANPHEKFSQHLAERFPRGLIIKDTKGD